MDCNITNTFFPSIQLNAPSKLICRLQIVLCDLHGWKLRCQGTNGSNQVTKQNGCDNYFERKGGNAMAGNCFNNTPATKTKTLHYLFFVQTHTCMGHEIPSPQALNV